MANTRIIPIPKDAPPATATTLREVTNRIYELESRLSFNQSEGAAGTKGLSSTVQNLSVAVGDLNSRYAVLENGDFYYTTGSIPADGVFYTFGKTMQVTIESPGPQKQTVVTIGAGEISVDSPAAGGAVIGEVTYKFSTQASYGSYIARVYLAGDTHLGVPVMLQQAYRLQPGVYTITAVTRAWCGVGSPTPGTVAFTQPYLRAEVIGSD